jgi:hypothetical protein
MDQEQAIKNIRDELARQETDLYVFQPSDAKMSQIPTPPLTQTARALATAFLVGFATPFKERAGTWAKNVGDWVCNSVEECFRPETTHDAMENDLNTAIVEAKRAYKNLTPAERITAMDETEHLLKNTLVKKGVIESRASLISSTVRTSMSGILA